ncbi:MAG: response regulator transcription factor [Bacteroidetes bacterium]|nr:response regulator transcription factor [Bacteroidota bacterium]
MEVIKIILVDDHTLFRDGIKSILDDEEHISVIEEAADAQMLFDKLQNQHPDMVITDISLPDMTGIEIASKINKLYPDIKILILSMHNNEEFILSALKAGANGYLSKDIESAELLEAIHSVMNGKIYFNKEISQTIINNYRGGDHVDSKSSANINLTDREIEVVKLVGEGFINKEIADKLCISIRTVDAHKSHIMQKLGLKSTVDLVKYAIKNKLIDL